MPGASDYPIVRVRNSSNTSIATSTNTRLSFDIEYADTDGIFDPGVPYRLFCQTSGKYLIFANIRWTVNANNVRIAYFKLNGVSDIHVVTKTSAEQSEGNVMGIYTVYPLVATPSPDYVELWVRQNSGISLNVISTADYSPVFGMFKIDDL